MAQGSMLGAKCLSCKERAAPGLPCSRQHPGPCHPWRLPTPALPCPWSPAPRPHNRPVCIEEDHRAIAEGHHVRVQRHALEPAGVGGWGMLVSGYCCARGCWLGEGEGPAVGLELGAACWEIVHTAAHPATLPST